MGRRLRESVVVRETQPLKADHPELGHTILREETLLAGSEVPDWAKDLIGDHVPFDDDGEDEPSEGSESDESDSEEPSGDSEGSEAPAEPTGDNAPGTNVREPHLVEKPAGNASIEAWQDYARSQGVSDDDLEGKSRDDLRDLYGS